VPIRRSQVAFIRGAWDGGAQDTGTRGLEDGVEGAGEVRSAVADQELEVVEALVEGAVEGAGLLHGPLPGGMCSDAAQVHLAGAMLDENQNIQRVHSRGRLSRAFEAG
jgi:hypothetical protein